MTTVRLLKNGEEAFPAMFDAMDRAASSISFEMYIIADDGTGREFREHLVGAARRGVEVRGLVDAWGSWNLPDSFWDPLREAGGLVRWFHPLTKGLLPFRNHRKLLLIDDSLSIRKFVGRMLETAGYEVDTAVDGEEGLRKASAKNYRLILTDLEMPKLNGYEVIQALRSRPQTQQTPIIVMTTRAGDKHRQMAINIGASSYIAKPVEERALIQELERWIGQESAARKA